MAAGLVSPERTGDRLRPGRYAGEWKATTISIAEFETPIESLGPEVAAGAGGGRARGANLRLAPVVRDGAGGTARFSCDPARPVAVLSVHWS
jgi:hypothetical protein